MGWAENLVGSSVLVACDNLGWNEPAFLAPWFRAEAEDLGLLNGLAPLSE
jgi:hypothetical protein